MAVSAIIDGKVHVFSLPEHEERNGPVAVECDDVGKHPKAAIVFHVKPQQLYNGVWVCAECGYSIAEDDDAVVH